MFRQLFKPLGVFNSTLARSVLTICISQMAYGFDNQGFSGIQSMDAFERQFSKWDPKTKAYVLPTTWLSMFNSFGFIGLFVGVYIGSMVSERYGRRWCMFSMSCWALVTATITITSRSSSQIMVGRVLNYLFMGMELSVVPVFQAEITPKTARGFVVGTYQLSLTIGGLVVNAVCYATQYRKDNSQFLIPFGLFYIIPSFIICSIWFIPESPRWLVSKDRHEEALIELTRLRTKRFTPDEIDEELQDIILGFQLERDAQKGSLQEIFAGTNLRRTLLVFAVNFFLQATGQVFTSKYGAIFIKSLGTINQFKMSMISAVINLFVSLGSMCIVDTVGRPRMLVSGGIVQAAALMTMGGLGTVSNASYEVRSAIVVMMVLYGTSFTFGWAPLVHTLSTELPSARLRDVTYRCGALVNVATTFVVSFTLPYLLNAGYANLQSKVGFVYGSFAVLSVIFAFFFVPDCRGRSLEEVNRLFEANVPARKFQSANIADIERVEETSTTTKSDRMQTRIV